MDVCKAVMSLETLAKWASSSEIMNGGVTGWVSGNQREDSGIQAKRVRASLKEASRAGRQAVNERISGFNPQWSGVLWKRFSGLGVRHSDERVPGSKPQGSGLCKTFVQGRVSGSQQGVLEIKAPRIRAHMRKVSRAMWEAVSTRMPGSKPRGSRLL